MLFFDKVQDNFIKISYFVIRHHWKLLEKVIKCSVQVRLSLNESRLDRQIFYFLIYAQLWVFWQKTNTQITCGGFNLKIVPLSVVSWCIRCSWVMKTGRGRKNHKIDTHLGGRMIYLLELKLENEKNSQNESHFP